MTAIDTTRDSLTLIYTLPYRGSPEEVSQTYFMDGATPATAASWKTLADNVIAAEKLTMPNTNIFVRAIGHKAGDSVAVFEYDYAAHSATVAGTDGGAANEGSGDTAVWVRWPTAAKTSKGKPIFLRTYFHPAQGNSLTDMDTTRAALKTKLVTFAEAWVTGFADGDAVVHHRAGPHGVAGLTGCIASPFTTTRTLERRGRRP